MKYWHVKELSDLTGVTVQTLHHYDHIDLLKPSIRRSNGYRLYSEVDLGKLQQIIALKSFGFGLSNISTLLTGKVNMMDHLKIQAKSLAEKAQSLLDASDILNQVVESHTTFESITWENIIKLIEVYKMTQALEHKWAKNFLNPEELQQFATFEEDLNARFSADDKVNHEQNWGQLIDLVQQNITKDPRSDVGIAIAQKVMAFVNELYGEKFIELRNSVWENGYKKGRIDGDNFIPPEIVTWLDQAMDALYRSRIYKILETVSDTVNPKAEWTALLREICGDSEKLKSELFEEIQADSRISNFAKDWLSKQ